LDYHIVNFEDGGCRVATDCEIALWKELAAAREALRELVRLKDLHDEIERIDALAKAGKQR
jgi:hypothetical protein